MTDWFTSDIHIGHKKIKEFCPTRPGNTTEEMHAGLVALWNERVTNTDTVYHLGDLSFTGMEETLGVIRQLNFGKMVFLMGNHDSYTRLCHWLYKGLNRDVDVIDGPYLERRFNGQHLVMHHYPQYVWNRSHHGSYHIHGHCHGSFDPRGRGRIADVGIDSPYITGRVENRPFSWEEIDAHMRSTPIWNADDHTHPEPHYGQPATQVP